MKRKNIKWLLCSVLLAIMFQSCWFIKQIPGTIKYHHYRLKLYRLQKETIEEYSYGEKHPFILKNSGIFIIFIISNVLIKDKEKGMLTMPFIVYYYFCEMLIP